MSQPAFDFDDDELDDAANPTYSVGELAEAINDALRRGFSDGVWVRGEITGWSDRGQHAYFTLVDDADTSERGGNGRGKAVVNVQFFANARMRLRPMLQKNRLRLADGMKVRVFGYLDYYAPNGRIGLKMTGIDPKYTIGDIAASRDEVIRRLVADGLLDANKRRPLSPIPLRIGVVTSVGTAAWHDFHDELQRSAMGFALTVIDTRVQGEFAEQMVAAAVTTLSRRIDLDAVVVIRGGGARNELAVFDAERIARAIASSPIPVLTGLGHEVDRSVADEVAHTTLKTPTACAGELIARAVRYSADTEAAFASIERESRHALDRRHHRTVRDSPPNRPTHPRGGRAGRRTARHARRRPRSRCPGLPRPSRPANRGRATTCPHPSRRSHRSRRRPPRRHRSSIRRGRPGRPAGTRMVDHEARRRHDRPLDRRRGHRQHDHHLARRRHRRQHDHRYDPQPHLSDERSSDRTTPKD